MDSTLDSTPVSAPAAGLLDVVLLPAATCAPASLVIAVDGPVSQETSALTQVLAARYGTWTSGLAAVAAAEKAAATPFSARIRHNAMGPAPSRGTPV